MENDSLSSDDKAKSVLESELQTEHEAWMNSPAFGLTTFVAKRWLTVKIEPADYGPRKFTFESEDGPQERIFNQEQWEKIMDILEEGDEVFRYWHSVWTSGESGLAVVRNGEVICGLQTARVLLTEPEPPGGFVNDES